MNKNLLDQVQTLRSEDFEVKEESGMLYGWSEQNQRREGLGADDKAGGGYIRRVTYDLYIDGLILRGGKPLMWLFDGGYVSLNDNGTPTSWNYYVADHLGSTRMVVGSDGTVKETVSYYPFGSEMRMQPPAQATGDLQHPFRFTGKELDRLNGLNWYDFGARWYDVAGVPMWTSIDPLCEKDYNVSPYAYSANDPVNAVDYDGMYWIYANYSGCQFFFFDPRVSSMNDVINLYYNGEERDSYDIEYKGKKISK